MGGKVKSEVFADHNGRRVYFCCAGCITKFQEDPEKYLKKLEDQGVTPAPVPCGKADADRANIDTPVLKTLLSSGIPVTILDARSGKYDDGKRIPGARSLTSQAGAEEVQKVIPSKKSLVITYCANLKCPASARLAAHLRKLGYTNVMEYPEGIEGWITAGGEVTTAG
jgi:rhodanese-related sulfurtransferase/YHS domain-containing protein